MFYGSVSYCNGTICENKDKERVIGLVCVKVYV